MPALAKAAVRRSGFRSRKQRAAVIDRTKMKEKAVAKRKAKEVNTGMSSLTDVNTQMELEYLHQTFASDHELRAYVCSLVRHGLLKEGLENQKVVDADSKKIDLKKLGKTLVGGRADKFRAIGPTAASNLLQECVGDDIPNIAQWFVGDDRLPGAVAVKALFFALGVTGATPLPTDHPHSRHEGPLKKIAKARYDALDFRLQGVTKARIDEMSNYFTMKVEDNERKVYCTLRPMDPLQIMFDLNASADWEIQNAWSYSEATLRSQLEGTETLLFRSFEKANPAVAFDDEFAFSDFPHLSGGLPTNTPASVAATASGAIVAGAQVLVASAPVLVPDGAAVSGSRPI
jgi:hypothetical protein